MYTNKFKLVYSLGKPHQSLDLVYASSVIEPRLSLV
jgi:hypothetical protein